MNLELPKLKSKALSVSGRVAPNRVELVLSGAADMRVEKDFDRIMSVVAETAIKRRVREVIVDVRQLTFINSGCLKVFVSWISDVRELAASSQYKMVFQSDRSVDWQRRSLTSLQCFGEELVEIR